MTTVPVPDPTDWADEAACSGADPDLFFAGDDSSQKAALALCSSCPVREPCLRFGTLETGRRQLIRERRRQLREAA